MNTRKTTPRLNTKQKRPVLRAAKRTPDPLIHAFASGEDAILANAYLVETRLGVVAVDGTLTVSSSRALRGRLEKIGKPLLAVLVTHGHPDHYNGIANLKGSDSVPVIATAGVDEVIRTYDEAKMKQWTPMFGKEWPDNRIFPDRILKGGESVIFDGVRFTVYDLGPGESHHDSYWIVGATSRYAFIGDAVLNGVHAYVSDGHTSEWIKNLEFLKIELAEIKRLFPGHGDAGGLELLDRQIEYLKHYRNTVKELAKGEPGLSDGQKKELGEEMGRYLGNRKLIFLVALGADAVAAELNKK